VKTVEVGV